MKPIQRHNHGFIVGLAVVIGGGVLLLLTCLAVFPAKPHLLDVPWSEVPSGTDWGIWYNSQTRYLLFVLALICTAFVVGPAVVLVLTLFHPKEAHL